MNSIYVRNYIKNINNYRHLGFLRIENMLKKIYFFLIYTTYLGISYHILSERKILETFQRGK